MLVKGLLECGCMLGSLAPVLAAALVLLAQAVEGGFGGPCFGVVQAVGEE